MPNLSGVSGDAFVSAQTERALCIQSSQRPAPSNKHLIFLWVRLEKKSFTSCLVIALTFCISLSESAQILILYLGKTAGTMHLIKLCFKLLNLDIMLSRDLTQRCWARGGGCLTILHSIGNFPSNTTAVLSLTLKSP